MGSMSISHWLIVLAIIVLLFGAKKIPELAKGMGKGIKSFKKEMEDDTSLEKIEKTEDTTQIKKDETQKSA
ncbi:twin-arginine translocase TatA/TatE family subunit [Campylobacter devanensis]|jgi:sec-independent protein translocase protein TatA|uniref:Sec-independent protein translocase protein TatA n=2 Tax=Campylobacter TaxID=194 RepID=A0A1X9STW3_9BACT|nr:MULTISPECIES: twin-arginine translocase TatA/TatE family subunit [Campylobacter]ARQ99719.1 twin arginine translocation system, TatA/E family protein [Campylobacter lanienae]MBP3675985.1 twin-arginine translocase TatA/TatE family subunit [Campylobacter sp.]MBR2147845.1 twin-arginine translocase TatA/TatE family subunit [Campylobacter sp.]MBR2164666.1 twin-arginine translocase TatA/TatE family subunit [Campylobacter sp.]MBR4098161.1 twin-arginine translocase TatA/TatE family subunit [Campylob